MRCMEYHRVDAAYYTLGLMTGLVPDIKGIHEAHTEYALALEVQDHAILRMCSSGVM